MKNFVKICIVALFCIAPLTARAQEDDVVRILSIGNSFSADAVEQHLYGIASAGGHKVIIGNMRIGGCSLEKHLNNAKSDKAAYKYVKINRNGKRITREEVPLSQALADEQWDFVTFQEQSPRSGIYSSWKESLPEFVAYVRARVPATAKVLIHQTWAYDATSKHKGFMNYKNDQKVMYKAIVSAVKKASKSVKADGVIPCGTAVQNARTTILKDSITRDGYHLHKTFGRYIASCTWYEIIFNERVTGNPYTPKKMTSEQKEIAQKSAHAAVRRPNKVTMIK